MRVLKWKREQLSRLQGAGQAGNLESIHLLEQTLRGGQHFLSRRGDTVFYLLSALQSRQHIFELNWNSLNDDVLP